MYADKITDSMKKAIDETARRRKIQQEYNEINGIVPKTINKEIREAISNIDTSKSEKQVKMSKQDKEKMMERIEQEMKLAAKNLDFERATELRDILFEMRSEK